MVNLPSLREMLDAGVHFGHKTSRWDPRMESYVFMAKNGVHVINLEKTEEELGKAVEYVRGLAASGKTIVFVGSKKQAGEIVRKAAVNCGMP
jgi:small subunit ribosomal protein S2